MIDFGVINNAIELSKRLGEVAKQVNNAEITSIAANLMLELAETKMALANAKTEQQTLLSEIEELKKNKNKILNNNRTAFKYPESEHWYCLSCYDLKSLTVHIKTFQNGNCICPSCKWPSNITDLREAGK